MLILNTQSRKFKGGKLVSPEYCHAAELGPMSGWVPRCRKARGASTKAAEGLGKGRGCKSPVSMLEIVAEGNRRWTAISAPRNLSA